MPMTLISLERDPNGETVRISFNTGRPYSQQGQIIDATVAGYDSDGWLIVRFVDHTRHIAHTVNVVSLSIENVMTEYDSCRYLD